MTSHMSKVIALSDAYDEMMEVSKSVAKRIKAEYMKRAQVEIDEQMRDREEKFVSLLRDAIDSGIPVRTIQAEVLHTNDWYRWDKWRKKAGLKKQHQMRRDERAEAEAARLAALPYRLARDADNNLTGVVEFVRDMSGEPMPAVSVRYMESAGKLRWTLVNVDDGLSGAFTDSGRDGTVYSRFGGSGSVERFWTFVSDSIQTGGDYNEMLAWAKAVKK